ncbi:MAG: metal-sensing transcriptional repressor [Ignavibacteriales bacterium]
MEHVNCCHEKDRFKHRTEETKNSLTKRLNIIEGQVRGIKQMIADDRYCSDVLIQLAAINKSIQSIGNSMLKDHIESCVIDEIKAGNNNIVDEVMDLFYRLQ